jgi:hypothetical protein
MRTIGRAEFGVWCNEHGLEMADREWPTYRGDGHHSIVLKLPSPPYKSVALARICFPNAFQEPFQGAMVWFRDWGIWNEADEETAMYVIERLRQAEAEKRPLMEAPGHIFSREEFLSARAFWAWPIIVGWDAFLIPEVGNYFVFNSHDEIICFVARTEETYKALLNEFKNWQPEESDWYFR